MDVLSFIKQRHVEIREQLAGLTRLDGAKKARIDFDAFADQLATALHLEDVYLLPELEAAARGFDAWIETCRVGNQALDKQLKAARKALGRSPWDAHSATEALVKLEDTLRGQFSYTEEVLMPKIREALPTQDREDLGQVFEDVWLERLQLDRKALSS